MLAFAGEDAEPRAACLNKFWARLRRVWVYEQSEESLWTVTFSPCGRTLATGGTDNKAKLYDVASGNLRREIVRTSSVDAVEFSPDGAWIAVGGRDSNAALYDVATFSLQLEFQSHNWVSSLAFSPDSASLAMEGRSEREICLYYVETGLRRSYDCGEILYSLAISPDGSALASAGSGVLLQSIADLRQRRVLCPEHRPWFTAVAFSHDSSTLVTGGWDKNITLFDVATGALQRAIPQADIIQTLTFSPDAIIVGDFRGKISVYELNESGSCNFEKKRFQLDRGAHISHVASSPGGRIFAAVSGIVHSTRVALFNSKTGDLLRRGAVPSNP